MVLELKVPHHGDMASLKALFPVFTSYVLSFIYIGIYWNNHHHMLHAVSHINGRVMWANMHLLFWLSLVPFASGWMGENNFTALPVAVYGIILFMNAVAYYILSQSLIRLHGRTSTLAAAIGKDSKGILSAVIYLVAILIATWNAWISLALYALVAAIWFVPDRRIEKRITEEQN